MGKIATDPPLGEITLRKYEPPVGLSDRELVRKLCLSLGLLQPGDSRDIIADILYVMLKASAPLSAKEIEERVCESRKQNKLPLQGVAPSNIRRQLLRLRDLFLLEKDANMYKITEGEKLHDLFCEHVERYYLTSITTRVKEYLKEADKRYGR